jgi:hypothetical protein
MIVAVNRGEPLRHIRETLWPTKCSEVGHVANPFFVNERENGSMLSHCANEKCRKPFLKLREGKLFLVESDRTPKSGQPGATSFMRARQQRGVEYYWLCDECAAAWTLVSDRERGVELAPLCRPVAGVRLAARAESGAA